MNIPRAERMTFSIENLLEAAAPRAPALLAPPEIVPDCDLRETGEQASGNFRYGVWHALRLSNDLLLARSDLHSVPTDMLARQRWELAYRGWLYMHFRLEGVTHEESPSGARCTLGGDTFLLSACPRPAPLAREVLGDSWRTVAIACRPDFLARNLAVPAAQLPCELRRFQSGDADFEFWHTGKLSIEMKSAVRQLLYPPVRDPVREVYLRAKVVELACLALDRLGTATAEGASDTPTLAARDLACVQAARRLLQEAESLPSLAALARRVGLNRSKLALGFRQAFGISVGAYYRELRLERGRRMLECPGARIASAAAAAGYSDLGSFTKAFKRRYGSLPSAMRFEQAPAAGKLRPPETE